MNETQLEGMQEFIRDTYETHLKRRHSSDNCVFCMCEKNAIKKFKARRKP